MKIIDGLRRDHELILEGLALLAAMSDAIDKGMAQSSADLAGLLEFFAAFADGQHHAKEEEMLFPALAEAGLPARGGPLMVMLAEHEEGRSYLQGLRALTGAGSLSSAAARAAFVTVARQYRDLLVQHISKENQVLFVMAERLLKGREAMLDEALSLREKALPPEATFERWRARIDALQAGLRAQDARAAIAPPPPA